MKAIRVVIIGMLEAALAGAETADPGAADPDLTAGRPRNPRIRPGPPSRFPMRSCVRFGSFRKPGRGSFNKSGTPDRP